MPVQGQISVCVWGGGGGGGGVAPVQFPECSQCMYGKWIKTHVGVQIKKKCSIYQKFIGARLFNIPYIYIRRGLCVPMYMKLSLH